MLFGAKLDYPYYPFRISVDYVLVSRRDNLNQQIYRSLFEKAIRREGLLVTNDTVGPICFTLISSPFHRLCREAEKLQLAFPLKNCPSDNIEPSCCQILSWLFVTREREHLVSAPFQRKFANLFVNYHEEHRFFTYAHREMLTHHILKRLDISKDIERNTNSVELHEEEKSEVDEPLRRKGLDYLLMEEAYESAFVLHQPSEMEDYFKEMKDHATMNLADVIKEEDDPRKNLSKRWTSWWRTQPLSEIRDYYGEQIAFYFAWQGSFLSLLWIAALAGLGVFVFGFVRSINSTNTFSSYDNCTDASTSRVNTNTLFSRVSSWFLRAFDNELNAIFAAFMSVWGSLFYQIWRRNNSVLAFSWDCEDIQEVEPDRPEYVGNKVKEDPVTGEIVWINPQVKQWAKILLSFLIVVFCMGVVVCSVFTVTLYKMWATSFFECTKQRTVWCSLLITYLPSVMNTISTMLLGAVYQWIVERLNRWENHRTHSEHDNALVIKLFTFQLVNNYTSLFYVAFIRPESHGFQQNGLFGLGPNYRDTCCDSTCGSLLAVQLLTHMLIKPIPKFTKDVVIPFFFRMYKEARWLNRVPHSIDDILNETDGTNMLVREWMKPDAGQFAFWEFNEKIILFGTTMMFAALFPLAPLIALLIGLADLRIDAKRLLWFNRKPVPAHASGIGIWLPILSFIQYFSVMTNAFIIAFTSDFCTNFYGQNCDAQSRLLIVIVFQNLVFVLKYIIQSVVPALPSSIRVAQRRQRFVVSHIIDKGDVPRRIRTRKLTRRAKLAWVTSRVTAITTTKKEPLPSIGETLDA